MVKLKLDILQKLTPILNNWYEEGLKTNPPQPLASMTRDPVCALFKIEGTLKRHTVLNAFYDEHSADNNSGKQLQPNTVLEIYIFRDKILTL